MSRLTIALTGIALAAAVAAAEGPGSGPGCCPDGWECASQPPCNPRAESQPLIIVTHSGVRHRKRPPTVRTATERHPQSTHPQKR
jgi:hypothetical protein